MNKDIPREFLDMYKLLHAVDFAAQKHQFQKRKNPQQTPYINHPVGVAYILIHEANVTDVNILQAAVLHDTIEDTDTTKEELDVVFGPIVTSIVLECTDDKTLDKAARKAKQIEKALKISASGKMVKLADKLYNLRDLKKDTPVGWDIQRVQEYFKWARAVITNCKGANDKLDKLLDDITNPQISKVKFDGKEYPCF